MKIRTGFVSNSSSSSFVIGKIYLPPKALEEFAKLIEAIDQVNELGYGSDSNVEFMDWIIDYDDDTSISEDEYYFFGDVGNEHFHIIRGFMDEYQIKEYVLS